MIDIKKNIFANKNNVQYSYETDIQKLILKYNSGNNFNMNKNDIPNDINKNIMKSNANADNENIKMTIYCDELTTLIKKYDNVDNLSVTQLSDSHEKINSSDEKHNNNNTSNDTSNENYFSEIVDSSKKYDSETSNNNNLRDDNHLVNNITDVMPKNNVVVKSDVIVKSNDIMDNAQLNRTKNDKCDSENVESDDVFLKEFENMLHTIINNSNNKIKQELYNEIDKKILNVVVQNNNVNNIVDKSDTLIDNNKMDNQKIYELTMNNSKIDNSKEDQTNEKYNDNVSDIFCVDDDKYCVGENNTTKIKDIGVIKNDISNLYTSYNKMISQRTELFDILNKKIIKMQHDVEKIYNSQIKLQVKMNNKYIE